MKPALPAVQAAPSRVVFGDGSLATFTYTWTGSERIHKGWTDAFKLCWETECAQKQPCVDERCYARAAQQPPGGGANLTLPWLLRAVLGGGNAKLVVLLRDPVERLHAAYFHYFHYQAVYGKHEAGFATFAREMVGHVQRCLAEGHGELACVTAFESLSPENERVFYHADQVLKSLYAPFMEGWLAAFGDDLLPLRLEDYAREPGARDTLAAVFQHIGLAPPNDAVWLAMLGAQVQLNGGPQPEGAARRGEIEMETRDFLRDFYRPYNRRLSAMLGGDTKWLWGY